MVSQAAERGVPGQSQAVATAATPPRSEPTELTRRAGVDLYTIGTDEDLVRALVRVSELRKRRRR